MRGVVGGLCIRNHSIKSQGIMNNVLIDTTMIQQLSLENRLKALEKIIKAPAAALEEKVCYNFPVSGKFVEMQCACIAIIIIIDSLKPTYDCVLSWTVLPEYCQIPFFTSRLCHQKKGDIFLLKPSIHAGFSGSTSFVSCILCIVKLCYVCGNQWKR